MTKADELKRATFIFRDWKVVFEHVKVTVCKNGFVLNSAPLLHIEQGDWKPCVEHCLELIDLARAGGAARCQQQPAGMRHGR